ncbi:MAG: aromatic ring-hydroxylating dioxygenase subunit alpha [Gammaproteobacteria bacterium]|nr:aromatic ring-hydroxylating dioxygenase subunit alpha [Gammaproteobacteria bacterium]
MNAMQEKRMSALDRLREEAIKPLEEAHSLSFTAYTDESVYAEEVKKIFHDEWVFVCQEPELGNPGDYFAMTLAGEPISVIRGRDGQLRTLSNVCRHRGTPLLDEGFGTVAKYVTCPYHAWSYDLAGELQAIPYNELIAVDRERHRLPQFQCGVWNGLVFVHLGDAPKPLGERFAHMADYFTEFEVGRFDTASSGEPQVWDANWKLVMENAMESYHLFKVHEPTLERVSPTRGAYYLAGSSEWSLTGGWKRIDRRYVLLSMAPSFVGILTNGNLGWLSAHPTGPARTMIRSGVIGTGKGTRSDSASEQFTQAFFEEDRLICERVQNGMSAVKGRGGKLVDLERVVADFHQFLATRLFDLPPTAFCEEPEARATRN